MINKGPYRLTLNDILDLGRVHEDLRAGIVGLAAGKGAIATPVIVALQRADVVVCRLYNKGEAQLTESGKARLAQVSVEQPAKENSGEDQGEHSGTPAEGVSG